MKKIEENFNRNVKKLFDAQKNIRWYLALGNAEAAQENFNLACDILKGMTDVDFAPFETN